MRSIVKDKIPEQTPRRLVWEKTIEGTIGELVLAGREQLAEQKLQQTEISLFSFQLLTLLALLLDLATRNKIWSSNGFNS